MNSEESQSPAKRPNTWKLLGPDRQFYESPEPGTFGGHRRSKIYGVFTCRTAAQAIARGGYVKHRVFFADEDTAVAGRIPTLRNLSASEVRPMEGGPHLRCHASIEAPEIIAPAFAGRRIDLAQKKLHRSLTAHPGSEGTGDCILQNPERSDELVHVDLQGLMCDGVTVNSFTVLDNSAFAII